jgi:hypothetical protein
MGFVPSYAPMVAQVPWILESVVRTGPPQQARIESLTRTHAVDILVSMTVRDALDDRFELRDMPPVAVKGKAYPIPTCAVLGVR